MILVLFSTSNEKVVFALAHAGITRPCFANMAKVVRNVGDDLPILKGLLQYGVAPDYMCKFIDNFDIFSNFHKN